MAGARPYALLTVSDVTVVYSDKTVVVTFSLKYGNMPFAMATTFTGNK